MYLDQFKIKDQLCEFEIELNKKYIYEYYNSIHTSQEIEINSPIEIGSKLICKVFLDSFKEIRGRGIIIVKTNYIRSEKILGSANATLLVP